MGDDLSLPERQSVRTVMQWSSAPNAGFSTAPADALNMPAIAEGPFGYERVNVAAAVQDPDSLLHWLRRAIATRKALPELGRGRYFVLPTDDPRVLALHYAWQDFETVAVHNLSGEACVVALEADSGARLVDEPFADRAYPAVQALERVEVGPYGYRWLRVRGGG